LPLLVSPDEGQAFLPVLAGTPRPSSRSSPSRRSRQRLSDRDFARLLDAAPHAYLILSPELRITHANPAYLQATLTRLEDLQGRHLFDAFPDNPDDPLRSGVRNLRASLEHVLATGRPHRMPLQRYDIRGPDGGFVERYWNPINTAVLDERGAVHLLIHHVEDVTPLILGLSGPGARNEPPAGQKRVASLGASRDTLNASRRQVDEAQELIARSHRLVSRVKKGR
jgi:PAS domain-containing protein